MKEPNWIRFCIYSLIMFIFSVHSIQSSAGGGALFHIPTIFFSENFQQNPSMKRKHFMRKLMPCDSNRKFIRYLI